MKVNINPKKYFLRTFFLFFYTLPFQETLENNLILCSTKKKSTSLLKESILNKKPKKIKNTNYKCL